MSVKFDNGASAGEVDLPAGRTEAGGDNRGGQAAATATAGAEVGINWWQRCTLGQFTRVILKGFRTQISEKDLFPLEDDLRSSHCLERFERKWLKEQKIRARKRGFEALPTDDLFSKTPYAPTTMTTSKNTIWAALIRSFWPFIAKTILFELVLTTSRLLCPLILGALIEEVSSSKPMEVGFGYCVALFVSTLLAGLALEHLLYSNLAGGLQARAALMSALYQKSLLISMDSQRAYPLGELMNMMSVDVENVFKFVQSWHFLWVWILRFTGTLALLWMQLGASSLAGAAVMLAQMPLSALIGHKQSSLQNKQMKEKGHRISMLTEILNGIKVIKLYAWEKAFAKKVEDIRSREVGYIRKFLYYQAALTLIWYCIPFLISLASFGCFVLIDDDNILTPKRVFVSITLFHSMSFSLTFIPTVIASFTRCKVSLRRVQNFLQADELDLDEVTDAVGDDEVVAFEKASFAWESTVVLDNLDLRIRRGELVAVIGQVGSGKSSLIESILGSMKKLTGHVHKHKTASMAYVPQQAWILNDSVRNNIVFTSTFDDKWYRNVVDKCCLLPDFSILERGDGTEIGEKGINLSGGQKQRISLARAVFQKAELYLLDDPLSAVDPHVLHDLFKDVIGPQGLLKNSTRILVTHSQAVLPFCDRIVLLKDGKIDFVGSYDDLTKMDVSIKAILGDANEGDEQEELVDHNEPESLTRKTSLNANISNTRQNEEELVIGNISWRVYLSIVKRFGILYAALCLMGYAVYEISTIWSMFWLRAWSNDAKKRDDDLAETIFDTMRIPPEDLQENSTVAAIVLNETVRVAREWSTGSASPIDRVNMFVFIGGIEVAGIVSGCLCLAVGVLKMSSSFHHSTLEAIMKAPLQFFVRTPYGRIVNRMSKDIDVLDMELFVYVDGWIICLGTLASGLAVMAYEVPTLFLVIVPSTVLFVFLLRVYQRNSRQLQRLTSVNRSPVLNHFSETVSGAASIRAFQAESKFIEKFLSRLDDSQNCILHTNASATWISIRTTLLCHLIVFALSLIIMARRENFDEGLAGLLLSYSLLTVSDFNWLFRLSSGVENTMIAAERLDQYCQVESEKPWTVNGAVDPLWPLSGSLKFRDYTASYETEQKPVLRGVNVEIGAGEKVGVVGRTGAGKSSLALALFRAIEATNGSISIDGVNIAGIGLHDLRKRLTIIPQDPILFRGTLRENIDPLGMYTDEEIWSALERAQLSKTQISLNMAIADGGENISVGERQLVSLARALLRRSKIVVLDEATAATDQDTDRLLQETIREDFHHSTVLTIAHRLETALHYDKIIVLSNGEIVEQGSPTGLLESKNSVFYSMAKDAGIV